MSKVSVIITTKDSGKFIEACIRAIQKSTYTDIEIIVVDNFSTDNTLQIAQSFKGVRTICAGPERSAQRNIGVHISTGDFIMVLDVDMMIQKDLIQECVDRCRPLTEEEHTRAVNNFADFGEKRQLPVDSLYIPEIIIGEGYWIKVRNFERSFYNGTRIDAIRFSKKDKWPMYDEELTGAEDWLHDRCYSGHKAITVHGLYHNEGNFNMKKYLDKKGYYCQWLDKYREKMNELGEFKLPELSIWYRYFWVFMEGGKWKKVIRHPLLFLSVLYLKMRIGVRYLCRKRSS